MDVSGINNYGNFVSMSLREVLMDVLGSHRIPSFNLYNMYLNIFNALHLQHLTKFKKIYI
jgi:hypothetical protein